MDTLTMIFDHHLWANMRLLDACADLDSEQMATSSTGSRGSIYETLEHIAKSEQSYFSRISTGQLYQRPDDEPPMTIAEMKDSLRKTGEGLIEWTSKVRPEDAVKLDWRGEPRDVPKSIILTQVISHAGEHREQVKAILTELGIDPPDLQSWAYFEGVDR